MWENKMYLFIIFKIPEIIKNKKKIKSQKTNIAFQG